MAVEIVIDLRLVWRSFTENADNKAICIMIELVAGVEQPRLLKPDYYILLAFSIAYKTYWLVWSLIRSIGRLLLLFLSSYINCGFYCIFCKTLL